jgi:SOS-response transcriptional repressor LexA
LDTEKGQFCLVPANGNYKTIYPDQELQVEAVVVGMIRKYGNGT